jgi:hypothetical protein
MAEDNLEDQDLILLDASQQINQTNVIPEYLGIQIPGTLAILTLK